MQLIETFLQDLRYGLRTLFRTGGFTLSAVLALALGIGVNTAVVTAYKAFIARGIDAREPATMVNLALRTGTGGVGNARFSYPDYLSYRDQLRTVSGVVAFSIEQLRLTGVEGLGSQRGGETVTFMGQLGILPPRANNAEFASTFL